MLRLFPQRLPSLLARLEYWIVYKLQIAQVSINLGVLLLSKTSPVGDEHFIVLCGAVKQIDR